MSLRRMRYVRLVRSRRGHPQNMSAVVDVVRSSFADDSIIVIADRSGAKSRQGDGEPGTASRSAFQGERVVEGIAQRPHEIETQTNSVGLGVELFEWPEDPVAIRFRNTLAAVGNVDADR